MGSRPRATRWVFIQIKSHMKAAAARSFLNTLHKACPIKMQKIMTNNGRELTDRSFAIREEVLLVPMTPKNLNTVTFWVDDLLV